MNWPVRESARHVLEQDSERGADAMEALAAATAEVLTEVAPLLRTGGHSPLAVLLALRGWGEVGAAIKNVLDQAEGAEWGPDNFTAALAFGLWRGRVAAQVQRVRDCPQPAAHREVLRSIVRTFSAPSLSPSVRPDGGLDLLDKDGRVLAHTPTLPAHLAAALSARPTALVTMNGQRVLRHFVTMGHEQRVRGEPGYHLLRFLGGLAGCAAAVGVKGEGGGKDAARDLSLILEAGRYFDGYLPGQSIHGLWTFQNVESKGNRPSILTVTLSDALLQRAAYESRNPWLQPITPMPPTLGRPNEWSNQVAFEVEVVGLLVEHREELLDDGGALLRLADLESAAARVGLSRRSVGPLMDFWSGREAGARRVLQRVGANRYHLADSPLYRAARDFLHAAGRMTKEARRWRAKGRKRGR